jgi:two-component system nitrogen regulation response regulator NtrX
MKVLIVDDNKDFSSTMADILKSLDVESDCANSPASAINYMEKNHSDIALILLDIEFGFSETMNGLELLEIFHRQYIYIPIVMISGKGTIETAVKATKLGAINFIEKNIITKEKIRGIIDSTINQNNNYGEASEIQNFLYSNGIIGKSKEIIAVGEGIIRFGRTDLNVIISGETGTGKKLVANALHSVSRRMRSKLITVDIPNIPKDAFQKELFGCMKGTYGETETIKGLFHQADKGTLFLDEIGEIPFEIQSSLLIPIEEKTIHKLGAANSENIDVRFISATNRDLLTMMKAGLFKEQLFHRLRECEICMPSLASRKEDIPDIINYYTSRHNVEFQEAKYFSPSAIDFLVERNWYGNVRELYSFVKVALQTSRKEEIEINEMSKIIATNPISQNIVVEGIHKISNDRTLKEDLAEVDKIKIEKTLMKTNGNVSKSAAMLGISRETLHNKIRRYEINTQQFRHRNNT